MIDISLLIFGAIVLYIGRIYLRGFYLAIESFSHSYPTEKAELIQKEETFNLLFTYYWLFGGCYLIFIGYKIIEYAPNLLKLFQ